MLGSVDVLTMTLNRTWGKAHVEHKMGVTANVAQRVTDIRENVGELMSEIKLFVLLSCRGPEVLRSIPSFLVHILGTACCAALHSPRRSVRSTLDF